MLPTCEHSFAPDVSGDAMQATLIAAEYRSCRPGCITGHRQHDQACAFNVATTPDLKAARYSNFDVNAYVRIPILQTSVC